MRRWNAAVCVLVALACGPRVVVVERDGATTGAEEPAPAVGSESAGTTAST